MKDLKKHKVLIIIVGSLMLLGLVFGGENDEQQQQQPKVKAFDKIDAKMWAEECVKEKLKSPSTADFSGWIDTKTIAIPDGFKVTGHVDSQNSFGAVIRGYYSVLVTREGGEVVFRNFTLTKSKM